MTYENTVVAIASALYFSVGFSYAFKGNLPWALVWFSYGMANAGLIWAATLNK